MLKLSATLGNDQFQVGLESLLIGGQHLLEFIFDDDPIIFEDILKIDDFQLAEGFPFPWDIPEWVDDIEAELQSLDDEFIECVGDVWMELLRLLVIFDLVADVLDESVYQFVAIEFALEGGLACLVEGLLQDKTRLFLFFLAILLLELFDFCYGFIDEDKTLVEFFHAGYLLLSLCPHGFYDPGVFE